jgi:predicted ATPase
MIKKIGVQNFRVFKDYAEFEIRPITILTGPNNSGKSSFSKLLLLLKNGIEELDFVDGEHNLISYGDNLSWNKESKYFEFLTIKLFGLLHCLDSNIETEFKFVESYEVEDGASIKELYINMGKENFISIISEDGFHFDGTPDDSINFSYSCDFNPLINLIFSKKITVDSIPMKELSASFFNFPELSALTVEKIYRYKSLFLEKDNNVKFDSEVASDDSISKKEYDKLKEFCNKNEISSYSSKLTTKEKGLVINNIIDQIDKENKLLFSIFINGEDVTNKYWDKLKTYKKWFFETGFTIGGDDFYVKNIYEELKLFSLEKYDYNSNLNYFKDKIKEDFNEEELNTLELKPTKLYNFLFVKSELFDNKSFWDWMIQDFSNLKKLFKDLNYIKASRGNQNRVLLFNYRKDIYNQFLLDRSKKYLQEIQTIFELPGEIIIESVESTAVIIYIKTEDRKINLADLGFGFSQLVPIILRILESPENATLIIEEPEANLHPKLQSKLADFFVISKKYYPSISFIIETHSEYFIRKLQYLTAKKEIGTDQTIIYYFNDDKYVTEKEPKVKSIEITETGGLTDTFGQGFFDEITKLQFDLLKLNKLQEN